MKLRVAILVSAMAAALPAQQVSFDRLLKASGQEPQNWLTYSGSYSGQRYSLLNQITPANAKNLELKWVFQARSLEKFEATPLVLDGVMYFTEAPNHVYAVDAKTGRAFWDYDYHASRDARVCCGSVNRGLAILGDLAGGFEDLGMDIGGGVLGAGGEKGQREKAEEEAGVSHGDEYRPGWRLGER